MDKCSKPCSRDECDGVFNVSLQRSNVVTIVYMFVVGSGQNINESKIDLRTFFFYFENGDKGNRSMYQTCYGFSGMPYQRDILGHKSVTVRTGRESSSRQTDTMLNFTAKSQLAIKARKVSKSRTRVHLNCGSCTKLYEYRVLEIESQAFIIFEYAKR